MQDGIVISQSIPSTELVAPGTTIRLQVGKAAPAPTTTVATDHPADHPADHGSADRRPEHHQDRRQPSRSPGPSATRSLSATPGPSTVTGAKVTDTMPSRTHQRDLDLRRSQLPGEVCNGNINNFSIDLPCGGSVTFTVTATVTATPGTLSNTATVSVPNGVTDPTPGNNSATDTDTLTRRSSAGTSVPRFSVRSAARQRRGSCAAGRGRRR